MNGGRTATIENATLCGHRVCVCVCVCVRLCSKEPTTNQAGGPSMCCERWSNEAATTHADITADHRDVPAVGTL